MPKIHQIPIKRIKNYNIYLTKHLIKLIKNLPDKI